jgi:hypothetical protein
MMFDYEMLLMIWIHWAADFLFQTDQMAINKSSSNIWLGIHCLVYSLPFFLFGFWFGVYMGVSHFIVDYITSRGTTKLWLAGKRHWFFTLIGFDQAIHLTLIFLGMNYFHIIN